MSQWKIWYHDRSTYSLADGPLSGVPLYGVICITQKVIDPTDDIEKHVRIDGPDFYHWMDSEWVGIDFDGIIDRLLNRMPIEHLITGRWIPRRAYLEILKDADEQR